MKKLVYYLFVFSLFFLPYISSAEVEIGVLDSDISVDIYPVYPQPYEDVTITLTSYATDLNKAIVEWRSGNKIILSGYGKKEYSFKALGPNTITSFEIIITPAQTGDRITKNFTINLSEVDLLWESLDGYTPPFYKGKSFISAESVIKVVAIPNSPIVKSGNTNMTYTWKNAEKTSLSSSGFNKDSYVFANSVLNDTEKIAVSASSVDGKYDAYKEINIPISSPKILFYKKSPTEGVLYNEAINTNSLFSEEEITIVAEPYFLAFKGNEDKFYYNWSINGRDIKTPSKKTELTVRPDSRGGYATIKLVLENMDKLFQKVTGQLKITL